MTRVHAFCTIGIRNDELTCRSRFADPMDLFQYGAEINMFEKMSGKNFIYG